jgi:squalene-associated FAD-dependent desaturase
MKVVVVGGGFAGLAAAVGLQEARHEVTLLERRGVLGGRATSYRDAASGEDVDNGTHLMVGAYAATLDLVRRAGASELLLEQENLRIDWRDETGWSSLDCPALAAPFHLLLGLLSLRIPWRVRLQALRFGIAVRFGRPPIGLTLAEYFARTGQGADARRLLWDPLALAILNESPERAAAVLFHRVYQEAFLIDHRASRLVFLRRGWGELAERIARYFTARGGVLQRRALVEEVETEAGAVTGVRFAQRAQSRGELRAGRAAAASRAAAEAVVLAVPWHALGDLLPAPLRGQEPFARAASLRPSPIVSVELWLDRVVLDRPMVGLHDVDVEWVFDKGRLYGRPGAPQHLAFIASAAVRAAARPNAELVASCEGALRRVFPEMAAATVTRSLVMREAAATFAADPAAEALRPGPATPVRGLVLAGDWTDTGLPATIEGAVRSGRRAAEALAALEVRP